MTLDSTISVTENKRDGEIVKRFHGQQGLPTYRFPTEGVCIELPSQEICSLYNYQNDRITASMKAVERLFNGLFPVISGPCDSQDFSTLSDFDGQTIRWLLHDQVRDGIGLTTQAYELIPNLTKKAIEQVESCKCNTQEGCFCCIKNPESEEQVSKQDCIKMLKYISKKLSMPVKSKQAFDIDILVESVPHGKCKACGAKYDIGNKFCSNCGERIEQ